MNKREKEVYLFVPVPGEVVELALPPLRAFDLLPNLEVKFLIEIKN